MLLRLFPIAALALASAVAPAAAATPRAVVPSQGNVDLAIRFPLRNQGALERLIAVQGDKASPLYHHWITPQQFRTSFGADARAMGATAAELRLAGLRPTSADSQVLRFSGSIDAIDRAFSTHLQPLVRDGRIVGRIAAGGYRVPPTIALRGGTVLGLGAIAPPRERDRIRPVRDNRTSPYGNYWFDDIKQAYRFPSDAVANGTGVTIATIDYNDFSDADVAQYLGHEKIGPAGLVPGPALRHAFAGSTQNGPARSQTITVELTAGTAPGATIVSYADSSFPFFTGALSTIVTNDSADIVQLRPSYCESDFLNNYLNGALGTAATLQMYHAYFMQGNAEGITFVAGTGDRSAYACEPEVYFQGTTGQTYPDLVGIDAISSDPNVTAVGFDNLRTSQGTNGSLDSRYVSEDATANLAAAPQDPYSEGNYLTPSYFGSGGGTSSEFPEPDYQKNYGLTYSGRSIPDVALEGGGCPMSFQTRCTGRESRDVAIVGGQLTSTIGTGSLSYYAGLLADKEQYLGTRLGNDNYELYAVAKFERFYRAFHQTIPGSNGVTTVAGTSAYNQVTGLGSPIGSYFVFDPFGAVAGTPQTASNP